jgi:predicted negative regulator of RcsB-dependent stress response
MNARTSIKLAGKRVAFTGQLASMTRPEAAELVRAHGGTFVTSVTRLTSMLVVGQEGWPLRKDGGLSGKLETAKHLQSAGCNVAILTEEELLDRLGLEGASSGIHKRFTLAQLGRLLKVPRDRLRAWMRCGLVQPLETINGVCYFDFHQVTGVRTLWDLTQAGVKTETIRGSLEQLTGWLPGLHASLAQLRLLEQDGQLVMRLGDGQLVDASGQLHFDFDSQNESEQPAGKNQKSGVQEQQSQVRSQKSEFRGPDADVASSSETLWQKACALEEMGRLDEAAAAYREALLVSGPDLKTCFNLANVLYGLGQLGQAAERYRQAVELDHDFVEGWNNLGNVLLELGQTDEALAAYRRALQIQPAYADAHYNLADALEQLEHFSEARRHWKAYLRQEPIGAWADYARRRLAN